MELWGLEQAFQRFWAELCSAARTDGAAGMLAPPVHVESAQGTLGQPRLDAEHGMISQRAHVWRRGPDGLMQVIFHDTNSR